MIVSKKLHYALLSFLILLSVVLRYPTTSHEIIGEDSYYYHMLGNKITSSGYATWVVSPFSLFGWYPFSTPVGLPYLLSGFSQCTGVGMEYAILIFSFILGVIGVLAVYALSLRIKKDGFFAFFVTLTFLTAPRLLSMSIWSVTSRYLLIVLSPLLFFLLLKIRMEKSKRWEFFALLFIFLLTATLIHKTFIFLSSILIAYVCAHFLFSSNSKKILSCIPERARFLLPFLIYGLVIMASLQEQYGRGVFEGMTPMVLLLNAGATLGSGAGIVATFFGFLGLIYLLWKKEKTFTEVFLILSLLFIIPFLPTREYIRGFIPVLLCFFAGFGLVLFFDLVKENRKITLTMFIVVILVSLGFASAMINHWRATPPFEENPARYLEGYYTTDETYSTAMFMKTHFGSSSFVCNDKLLARRLQAFSDKPCLPSMGFAQENNVLIYGFIDEEALNTTPIGLYDLSFQTDYLFTTEQIGIVRNDYITLMSENYESGQSKEILSKYRVRYAVEDNRIPGKYLYFDELRGSNFYSSLHQNGHKVYDNGRESIWYIPG